MHAAAGPARLRRSAALSVVALLAAAVLAACAPGPPPPPAQQLISLGAGGVLGDDDVVAAALSADGRFVALQSEAANLTPGAPVGGGVYVRDRVTGAVDFLGVGTGPRLSADGRFVSWRAGGDLVVRDRTAATTTSWVAPMGATTPVVAPDGSVAVSGAPPSFGLFATSCTVRDLASGVETSCPPGAPVLGTVAFVAASRTARFVLYSWQDLAGTGTGGFRLWDRATGVVVALPGFATFPGAAHVADDGATLLGLGAVGGVTVPVRYDVASGVATTFPLPVATITFASDLTPDGRVVAVATASPLDAADTNGVVDVGLWDVDAGTVRRVSGRADRSVIGTGGFPCGTGGQVTADGGAACFLAGEAVLNTDTNGRVDAYLSMPLVP